MDVKYEREVNYGHRSALKKILDGDVSPASMMVLCVSAIYSTSRPTMLKANDTNYPNEDIKNLYNSSSTVTKINYETRIELMDEAIMSEQSYVFVDINDSDEGAKLCEILETAAEPEVLMADMTSKQLFSFSIYQAKQKEIRQSHLQKEIEKALKDAGLALRRPFFNPRKSVNLSNLGEIPLARMFACLNARKSNGFSLQTDAIEQRDCLLAVSFSSPMVDKDLFSHHHEGTVVGFYYLVKRARDQTYHLWVAKATENSTYSYKVIKVLHFSSMTNAFQGFNDEVRFAALLLPQVKTQKTGIEEAVYSGISILVRGNTKILYQIHVAWYRLQRG
ncbi:BRCA2, helical [Musa troglodytarum]|uniref:BRCA2, helical n=1 Tax=Musa troglodytarum TaxID=320322 RepID=A0A9E7H268_9LILI|nr:BRCA2, helical [Musa troglodytarum]URE25435.1 BRCA2, helical [Musa troglodytarum]